MTVRKKRSARAFWALAEKASAEVATWPAWKRGAQARTRTPLNDVERLELETRVDKLHIKALQAEVRQLETERFLLRLKTAPVDPEPITDEEQDQITQARAEERAGRGTGRTSRMLAEVHTALSRGITCYVLAADRNHATLLQQRFVRMCGKRDGAQVLDPPYQVSLHSPASGVVTFDTLPRFETHYLNMSTGEVRGADLNTRVFIDHYAIEARYAFLLKQWQRWSK